MGIYYKTSGPEAAPPLLLLHELGGSHQSWQWLDPRLGDRFRRIIVDLPGAGQSALPGEEMSLDDMAACVAGLLDELNIQRAFVAGSAYGAVVSAYLAANYPDRVEALMLIAIGHSISAQVSEYVNRRADQVEREGMEAVVGYSLQSSFPARFREAHPDIFNTYQNLFINNDPHHYAVCSRAIAAAGTTLTDRIRAIRARTAVVGGKLDPSFTPAVVEEVGKLLHPPVKPVIVEEAGHFPQIQAPEKLAELICGFFLNADETIAGKRGEANV